MSIPLYPYQQKFSDMLSTRILESETKYVIEDSKTVKRVIFFESPVGSGKTRMICRTISKMINNLNFNIFRMSLSFYGEESTKEFRVDAKIIIIVPVSTISQWVEELNLWKLDFYLISTPKQIKSVFEIENKIILVSNIRATKLIVDATRNPSKKQIYLFLDEFDTMDVSVSFHETIMRYIKVPIFVSANCDAKHLYRYKNAAEKIVPGVIFEHEIVKVDSLTVDAHIFLPEINENIINFSLIDVLNETLPLMDKKYSDQIIKGNIMGVLKQNFYYSAPSVNKLSLQTLLNGICSDNVMKIEDHKYKTKCDNDKYIESLRDKNNKIQASIYKYSNFCTGCGQRMVPNTSIICHACLGLYCDEQCASSFDVLNCKLCSKLNSMIFSEVSSDVKDTVFRSRAQIFDKMVKNIKSRDGESKKILVYCNIPSLVSELDSFLAKNNYWSIVLQGSQRARDKSILKVKEADTDIFLVCNSVENSAGIHFPEITDIVIYHELDDKFDSQVVGRAQRVGRTFPLYVHRIEYSMIIEE